ncbi:hypothetical protein [Aeropyrum camini]|uniref:Uncharacterized protein n=1 Tax=Aeropyrum camini SY1 = JCM 12091 TaxID=1198449 RepID=U3TCF1_9CREN|nr:hypothetical protein [Aeropyrum camini]BAN89710.1 hypothetical protein ACAM_0241 [Aeropyrum camini SY1 = JCM 12091]
MSGLGEFLEEIVKEASRRGFSVEKRSQRGVVLRYEDTPLALEVATAGGSIVVDAVSLGDVEEIFEDYEGDQEELRNRVEELLDEVESLGDLVSGLARKYGFQVEARYRRSLLDFRDALEDYIEAMS